MFLSLILSIETISDVKEQNFAFGFHISTLFSVLCQQIKKNKKQQFIESKLTKAKLIFFFCWCNFFN